MKAIAYNITSKDKELLILANYKKHDITIIANSLSTDTLSYANGKQALILFNEDPLNATLINGLKEIGIKYIATSSRNTNNIDLKAAADAGLRIVNIPFKNSTDLTSMQQVIKNLDNWN